MENTLCYTFWQCDAQLLCFAKMVAAGEVEQLPSRIYWLARYILIMGWSEDPACEETFKKLVSLLSKNDRNRLTS